MYFCKICMFYYVLCIFAAKNVEMKNVDENETNEIFKKIGENVRFYRKKVSGNYEVFAKENNINKVKLANIEKGGNTSVKSLLQVSKALGVKLVDLFENVQ